MLMRWSLAITARMNDDWLVDSPGPTGIGDEEYCVEYVGSPVPHGRCTIP
jgi:hypothetical protein